MTIKSKRPFCNSDHGQKTTEERVAEITNRVAVNDASAMCALAKSLSPWVGRFTRGSHKGTGTNIIRASDHGFNDAHVNLGNIYYYEGDLKKAKALLCGATSMAGHELARFYLGNIEMKNTKIGIML